MHALMETRICKVNRHFLIAKHSIPGFFLACRNKSAGGAESGLGGHRRRQPAWARAPVALLCPPAVSGERLEWIDAHRVRYRLPKPRPDGRTELILSPPQLIERVGTLPAGGDLSLVEVLLIILIV